ncbi:mucin-2-like isoform X2 [Rhopalosiphum padi]|uniref:mucin-2-like isoform X2 n=1 Tax=Rhopalosiphum padi TaxID=40932 RepID=UPI00298E0400|nr:mucin-2-like isoform X2 [Rhopalosiphum padi]
MDQNPRPSCCSSSTFPTPTAVTCQVQTTQMASTIISPPTNSYVLTSSNLRPVTNYTLVASSQVPVTHQYVVQSTARTTIPQYVSTGNVKHIMSPSTQQSNVTYMLPSGAHIVRMNNVVTTTVAGEQKSNTQYILTSSTQKTNSSISPLGTQSSISSVSTDTENNSGSSVTVSRTVGVTTCTSPIFQRTGINFPRLNATYYSQIKGNDTTKISFKPKLNEQKPGTSYILTSNDWSRTKNVPISSLQKINTNYMQIPLIQKPGGTVLSTNTLRSNVDIQQQKSQHQSIRSVILPSNYRTAVSPQQGTDCKLVLNSINVTTQGINSTDSKPSSSSTPVVSNIQQLNTNYMQIPISQKSGTILTRNNTQPNIENNIRIGQHQTIRSVILPSNYRAAMVSSPRRGVDYRLILKPVIRNLPPPRIPSPRNSSIRNTSPRQNIQRQTSPRQNSPRQSTPRQSSPRQSLPRQTPLPVRSNSFPTRVPLPRPSISIHNEVIANSKITPIPLRKRIRHLVITERSVKICMDEVNSKNNKDSPSSNLTDEAIKIVQAEVTYRLFYLLRECKKFLIRSRSNVLTEEAVRQVCAEYFGTFFGNKLWPLFCLKWTDDGLYSENEENRVWMRKHNNVNLIGWLKHPKFRNPSYIQKRRFMNLINNNPLLPNLENISEVVFEHELHNQKNQESVKFPKPPTRRFYQSLNSDQVTLNKIVAKKSDDVFTPTSHKFMDIPLDNQLLSTTKQISSTIIQSQRTQCNPE